MIPPIMKSPSLELPWPEDTLVEIRQLTDEAGGGSHLRFDFNPGSPGAHYSITFDADNSGQIVDRIQKALDDWRKWEEARAAGMSSSQPGPQRPEYEPVTLEQKLGYAVEECGELLHALGKTIRWGPLSFNPEPGASKEVNADWIRREWRDVKAAMDRLMMTLPHTAIEEDV